MDNVTTLVLSELASKLEISVEPKFGKKGSRIVKKDYIYALREHFAVRDQYLLFKLYPYFFQPMLCCKDGVENVTKEEWIEEPKYEGVRLIIELNGDKIFGWSRVLNPENCIPLSCKFLTRLFDFSFLPNPGLYDCEITLDRSYKLPQFSGNITVMTDGSFFWDPILALYHSLFGEHFNNWIGFDSFSEKSFRCKIFDCLGIGDESFQNMPLGKRKEKLLAVKGWNDSVDLVVGRWFDNEDLTFSGIFIEGKVYKNVQSTYDVSGNRNKNWIKQRYGLVSVWKVLVYNFVAGMMDLCVMSKERNVLVRIGLIPIPSNLNVNPGDVLEVKTSGWLVGHGGHSDIIILGKGEGEYTYSDSQIYWGRRVLVGI